MSESEVAPHITTIEELKKPHQHGDDVLDLLQKHPSYPEQAARDIVAGRLWQDRIRAKYEEARKFALTDELTGALNRRGVMEALNKEINKFLSGGRLPLSIMYVDLDNFKPVNDDPRGGHAVGDDVLRQAVGVLELGTKDTDKVGRVGGDEFVVILPETPAVELNQKGDLVGGAALAGLRILEELKQEGVWRFMDRGLLKDHPPGATIGIAEFMPGEDSDSFLVRAEQQTMRGKRGGAVGKGNVYVAGQIEPVVVRTRPE